MDRLLGPQLQSLREEVPGVQSQGPQCCEIYLQEFTQVAMVNTGEKLPWASGRGVGEEKEPS